MAALATVITVLAFLAGAALTAYALVRGLLWLARLVFTWIVRAL